MPVPFPRDFRRPRDLSGRLTRRRVAWYTGNAVQTDFALPAQPRAPEDVQVYVAGLLKRPAEPGDAQDYSVAGSLVSLTVAPANGADVCILVHGV